MRNRMSSEDRRPAILRCVMTNVPQRNAMIIPATPRTETKNKIHLRYYVPSFSTNDGLHLLGCVPCQIVKSNQSLAQVTPSSDNSSSVAKLREILSQIFG